ncbi:Unconventional myosin-VI [Desmophyllum pertusum]|uniref:Unconventional myosin-VI n=1 Tax=Desmophyllum pertusum TaxID=174260 RepID=A0A9W9YNT9_9CNID|nr:Unconventional myosin-VI [Desmophyllum pertusum]
MLLYPHMESEIQVLQVQFILEAFWEMPHDTNINSSRFAMYYEVYFSPEFKLSGGKVHHYMLEKSRVVHQEKEILNILKCLASVLHIGNIAFGTTNSQTNSAFVKDPQPVHCVLSLGIAVDEMGEALITGTAYQKV